MSYVNIHCHMIYGIDDGAETCEMMFEMIDRAYEDGVRTVCMTPHYNPAMFRYPADAMLRHYEKARAYASEKYPELELCLGNEVYCYHDTAQKLVAGKCLSLNGTRNVLVEFGHMDSVSDIIVKMSGLVTSGYTPVVAHVERYDSVRRQKGAVEELRERGAYIQVNAAAILGGHGFFVHRYVMSLIKRGLVDVVADDSHNVTGKAPCLGRAYALIERKFGKDTADRIFAENPKKLIRKER